VDRMNTGTIEGDGADGEWEYRPVRLPPEVSRVTASVRLAIQAEFGGWELSRVRLYPGGTRQVLLRRRRSKQMLPNLSY
jgi:stress response protein SCP2